VLIKIFSSTYTAIILIALIVLASAYGTLLAPSPTKGVATLYASPIFSLLFFLLAINIIFCSLRRLPKVLKHLKHLSPPLLPDYYMRQKYSYIAEVNPAKKEPLLRLLRKYLHYGITQDGKHGFFSQKGILNQFGSYVLHTGILIILSGGLMRFILLQTGYVVPNARLVIPEAQSVDWFFVPGEDKSKGTLRYVRRSLGFKVRCLDFDEVKYPGSDIPEAYSTTVEIEEGGLRTISIIDMNHTLRWQGFKIHQLGFEPNDEVSRYLVEVRKKTNKDKEQKVIVDFTPGTPIPLTPFMEDNEGVLLLWIKEARPNAQWEITRYNQKKTAQKEIVYTGSLLSSSDIDSFIVTRLVPDFRIDEQGRVFSATPEFNNPAIYVVTYKGDIPMRGRWCFFRKEFRGMGTQPGDPYAFKFVDYHIDPSSMRNPTLTVEVVQLPDKRVIGRFQLGINEPQQIPGTSVTEDTVTSPGSALSRNNPFSVRLISTTQGYTTILGLVREPTTPLTFIGGGIVVLGAFFIFFLRYRRIFALYDEHSGKLYITLVCRNPGWRTEQEWKKLLNTFSFLETK